MTDRHAGPSTEQRLAALEDRCTRLHRIALALGGLVLIAGSGAFAVARGPRVDAQHLVLSDSLGRASVELTIGKDGRLELRFKGQPKLERPVAQMVLIDESGRVAAQLGSEMVHQLGR